MSAAKKIAVALFSLVLLAPASQASAAAAPAWQLNLIPMPTNMEAGSTGTITEAPLFRLLATNIGGKETSGPVTFTATLPSGVTPIGPEVTGDDTDQRSPDPVCSTAGQEVTCTTPGPVYPSRYTGAVIPVEVSPTASGVLTADATVSGSGGKPVSTTAQTEISSTAPDFGFLPGPAGLASLLTDEDGSASTRAGSHPDQLTINLAFPSEHSEAGPTRSAGHVRDVITNLPQGLIINPNATPERCTELEFLSGRGTEPGCPDGSQIGVVNVMTEVAAGPKFVVSHLYNMVPPPGASAEVAFNALEVGIFIHLAGHLRSEGDYGITATSEDIVARTQNPILDVQVQIWGDPSSDSHSEIRGECRAAPSIPSCPLPPQRKPVLTMPSACSQSLGLSALADSWEVPGVFDARDVPFTDTAGNPVGVNECSSLEFEPTLNLEPVAASAETPSGVDIDLHVPQNEGMDELATSNLKDTTISFPPGMAINPAAADGLAACSPAQIGLKTAVGETPIHFTASPPSCPSGSKIGTVSVNTPLLDHPVPGAVYVAEPYQNPFGTLLGTYIVIDSPKDGLVIKLAGRTEADPETGQLTVSVDEAPELPFEDFDVHLFGGPRSVLRTPATCGSFATRSEATPWSGTAPVKTTDSFVISQGANGAPCVASEAQLPGNVSFEAGTKTPLAATFSPFLTRLQRPDGSQPLQGLQLTLPPGLSGKLAGHASCSDPAIIAAAARSAAAEAASPSCPANSQVGVVQVGVGAGPTPYHTTGKVYLSDPYAGAPLSLAVITPAAAGPFDLGTVVTRAALYVDPVTTAITVQSDPLPRILQGIPLQIRDVRVDMSAPNFTLNPTSCDEMQITGSVTSAFGQLVPLSQRFQVGGCSGLKFKPKLAIKLKGGTRRSQNPSLRATLTMPPGGANVARASVALPHTEFLDQAHIRTVCTRVQFAAGAGNGAGCPAGAIYGKARAFTPLLDSPLEGPVYLRSSDHLLPDLVVALHGRIDVDLVGRIDSHKGGIRTTFEGVPDAPVSKFVLQMQGGKKGLLENSVNLCRSTSRANAALDAQSGKVSDFKPLLKNSCKK